MSQEVELAWAAGFFDGEGSFTLSKSGGYLYPQVTIGQVDREVLDRFAAAVGVGKVRGPYSEPKYPNKRPVWQYGCYGEVGTRKVLDLLFPYLGTVKREQGEEVMARRSTRTKDSKLGRVSESKMLDEEAVDVEAEGSLV